MTAHDAPLVSCIMPTANRRAYVPRAIGCFLAQTYEQRELVILDDGADPVADLVPDDPRVRYMRAAPGRPLGAKRNACVEAARGDLIMHWDDDDWHAPHRIAYQVEALRAADAQICGLRQMLFYSPAAGRAWLFSYPAGQRLWLAGGSLLYTRAFWRRAPFPAIGSGEDTRFIWGRLDRGALAVPDFTIYVATVHQGNTSRKRTVGPYWAAWDGDALALMNGETPPAPPAPPPAPPPGAAPLRLNLGCCDRLLPGFVNVDLVPGPAVQVADLREPWPWADGSVAEVRAHDIVEHLPDKIFTMNELWRVLRPGGSAEIAVPTTDGTGAFQDPTHVSFWNRRSFLYYEAGNPYRERFAAHYGIQARFRTLAERVDRSPDGPRLTITLRAEKP